VGVQVPLSAPINLKDYVMTNYDGLFFINHALNGIARLSVYNEKERFQQTIETLNSINKYCPNNKTFIFDSSPTMPNREYISNLVEMGAVFFYTGDNYEVNHFSNLGQRSIAETISFIIFLSWFKEHKEQFQAKRIYKLSGRYRLNDNFIADREDFKDAFVFVESEASWFREASLKRMEMDEWQIKNFLNTYSRLYKLRLWHMDFNLVDEFENQLKNILADCVNYRVDVEHSYYKNLHTYKTIELDKIGVCGNIAPSGDYIDE
jgi:hypothetical protein